MKHTQNKYVIIINTLKNEQEICFIKSQNWIINTFFFSQAIQLLLSCHFALYCQENHVRSFWRISSLLLFIIIILEEMMLNA